MGYPMVQELALGLAAGSFLDLGLVLTAGASALGLGGSLLAGGPLEFLAFYDVGDFGGVQRNSLF